MFIRVVVAFYEDLNGALDFFQRILKISALNGILYDLLHFRTFRVQDS